LARAILRKGQELTLGRVARANSIMHGNKVPGREFLEAVAALAGLHFEDCIVFPENQKTIAHHGQTVEQLLAILNETDLADDFRRSIALAYHDSVEKPRRQRKKRKTPQ
jgi:hypothetical protein